MKKIQKYLVAVALLATSVIAFAQADSTTYQGLYFNKQTPNNVSSGNGVPDPAALSPSTSYVETEVLACDSTGGNGYGFYPNGPIPADGTNVAGQTVTGGKVYDQTVTTDRFGTKTYSGWTLVNNLCTPIPYPPGCPSGQIQTAAPYWDWGSNSWQGLQCAYPTPPVTTATQQAACGSASFGYNGQMSGTNSMGIYNGIVSDMSTYAEYAFCWGGFVTSSGSNPGNSSTIYDTYSYELGVGTDPYGYGQRTATGGAMCWLQPGTNNVVAKTVFGIQRNPGSCH